MSGSFTRRDFLRGTSTMLAGAAAASMLSVGAIAEEKPGSLRVTCRDSHLRVTGEKDCWSAMKAIGAEGVEAVIGEDLSFPGLFHPEQKYSGATDAGIERLAADMKAAGRPITAFCMYNRYDERPEFEVEWGTKVARVAQALGVKAVRIDVVPHKLKEDAFFELSVDVLKKLTAATQSTGVAFGIENHGGTTNRPEFLRPLFERVGSPRLGLTLDTGNFYWYGHPLSKIYEYFKILAPRVFHTHCKSIRFPESERDKQRPMGWQYERCNCPIYEGDVDFRRVIAILREAGYTNDMCVEDESLGRYPEAQRPKILAKEISLLKELVK